MYVFSIKKNTFICICFGIQRLSVIFRGCQIKKLRPEVEKLRQESVGIADLGRIISRVGGQGRDKSGQSIDFLVYPA